MATPATTTKPSERLARIGVVLDNLERQGFVSQEYGIDVRRSETEVSLHGCGLVILADVVRELEAEGTNDDLGNLKYAEQTFNGVTVVWFR